MLKYSFVISTFFLTFANENDNKLNVMNEKSKIYKTFEEKLRETHDECKDHPFWKTFDICFHTECVDILKKACNMVISNFDKDSILRSPHAMLLIEVLHNNYDAMLKSKLMYKSIGKNITETSAFGNYILCMQTLLQVIHYYLDGIFDENEIVIYDPHLETTSSEDDAVCTYKTWCVRQNEDGTYRNVLIISENEVEALVKRNKDGFEECSRVAEEYKKELSSDPYGFIEGMEKRALHYKELYDSLVNRDGKHYIIK